MRSAAENLRRARMILLGIDLSESGLSEMERAAGESLLISVCREIHNLAKRIEGKEPAKPAEPEKGTETW